MAFAELAVNTPVLRPGSFSYSIPLGLEIKPGQAVWAPFGPKIVQGIVLEITDQPAFGQTREICGVISDTPLLSFHQLKLAKWISQTYLCSIYEAVALMLPPSFERQSLAYISLETIPPATAKNPSETLSPNMQKIFDRLKAGDVTPQSELEKIFGKKTTQNALIKLINQGLVKRTYRISPARVQTKFEKHFRLSGQALAFIKNQNLPKLSPRQTDIFECLRKNPLGIAKSQLNLLFKNNSAVLKALEQKGLVSTEEHQVFRQPIDYSQITPMLHLELSPPQAKCLQAITHSLNTLPENDPNPRTFLLHGITGSGKTEIYLQSLAETLRLGRKGIVLVPEISLTPQTIARFAGRFPGKIAVLHSRLSPGEQFDEWQRIKNDQADIVIGPRSALFAPLDKPGIIIIDEEHEWTYKQQDPQPRYHTRTVANKMAEEYGAVVVLGSATPDIDSYFKAKHGIYQLLELPERLTPYRGASLPKTELVDMRTELSEGNRSIFSRNLHASIEKVLANHEQAILFINRRGGASFIQCRDCGYVAMCKSCDAPLTYHPDQENLVCHQCGRQYSNPLTCPKCSSRRIKYLGIGTQKLEEETRLAFPQARLLRWDSDVTRGKNKHQQIMDTFSRHQADILIGTQMVAKGLDLPAVTLVGVINADISLNLPDFRAGERTFQLLAQVAGRAGRGISGGKVIIQTYTPENYAIQAAVCHDYQGFYAKEITYRRELNNPPFRKLACIVFSHLNHDFCRQQAEVMAETLREKADAGGSGSLEILGPAPAFIQRLRGRYRYQLILRSPNPADFLRNISFGQGWSIDLDPYGLC
ncbi:primosomal protein N' [Dehalococcoides mccartyi]|uniref:primosomal protein N' n=1 Tax=Dehalococcoides mccartyi TaxID=61435 RepID=UPI0004E0A3BE|nr:primosomal protein N' [Dehalococcoides mccartyi]AII57492.1 primosomal protein N' [Dehalococcoides mccartyi CG1]APH11988.1 primosomal protein N' [Dehalococcoides mccartyi]